MGTGIADDKSIYPYVPEMIEFYLGEKPILNNVPTFQCRKPDDLAYTLAHLSELVVKEVHGAGGYGMLVGPASTKAEIESFRERLIARPAGYIAQPTLALSACPTLRRSGHRAAPYRFASLRAVRQERDDVRRRSHARWRCRRARSSSTRRREAAPRIPGWSTEAVAIAPPHAA